MGFPSCHLLLRMLPQQVHSIIITTTTTTPYSLILPVPTRVFFAMARHSFQLHFVSVHMCAHASSCAYGGVLFSAVACDALLVILPRPVLHSSLLPILPLRLLHSCYVLIFLLQAAIGCHFPMKSGPPRSTFAHASLVPLLLLSQHKLFTTETLLKCRRSLRCISWVVLIGRQDE